LFIAIITFFNLKPLIMNLYRIKNQKRNSHRAHLFTYFFKTFLYLFFISLFHLSYGQSLCDAPEVSGVPEDMTVESKFLQTTKVTYYLANGESLEASNELTTYDYVAMKPTTEVEQITMGYNDLDDNIYVREVVNTEEYFPSYVLPYSHTVLYGGISTFYQGDQPIHTTIVDSSFINGDVNDPEDGEGVEVPVEGESSLDFVENEDGKLLAEGEGYEIILDTVENHMTTVEYDSLGNWQYRLVEQFSLEENTLNLPLQAYSVERMETVNGLCAFKVVEKDFTHYCHTQEAELRSAEPIASEFDIRVYPNPVRNNLNIVPSQSPSDQALLQVFDVSGKEILRREGPMVKNLIPFRSQVPGLYFIRYTDDNQVITKKIIKQ